MLCNYYAQGSVPLLSWCSVVSDNSCIYSDTASGWVGVATRISICAVVHAWVQSVKLTYIDSIY